MRLRTAASAGSRFPVNRACSPSCTPLSLFLNRTYTSASPHGSLQPASIRALHFSNMHRSVTIRAWPLATAQQRGIAARASSMIQRRSFATYQEQTEEERKQKRKNKPKSKDPWWKQNDNDFNKGQKAFAGDSIEMAVRDQNIKLLEKIMAQNADFAQRKDSILMVRLPSFSTERTNQTTIKHVYVVCVVLHVRCERRLQRCTEERN
jgi:hypothetical protein